MNITAIKKLISRPERSAREIRQQLEAIDVAALDRNVVDLEAKRRSLLLTGTDAELESVGAEIKVANLAAERADFAVGELRKALVQAEAAEKTAELEAVATENKVVHLQMMRDLVEIDEAAGRLAELLDAMQSHDRKLQENNRVVVEGEDRRAWSTSPALQAQHRQVNAYVSARRLERLRVAAAP